VSITTTPNRAVILCRFQNVDPGGSLRVVMRIKASWARMVVAIFTMAMFYASVCSASCAAGVCPDRVQQTTGHDCEKMPSDHSSQSGHRSPDNPDCSQHQHPGLFVAKSGNFSQFQLSVADHLNASTVAVSALHRLPRIFTHPAAFEHAPLTVSSVPPYEQISVLRI
jgi:hypothetical protein